LKLRKGNWMNLYVKLPEMWRRVLNARPTTAADWKIAVELLRRAKFSPIVKLTKPAAEKLGISPRTRFRCLDRLEHWGLISIRRRVGAALWIRVLWLAGRQPSDG